MESHHPERREQKPSSAQTSFLWNDDIMKALPYYQELANEMKQKIAEAHFAMMLEIEENGL